MPVQSIAEFKIDAWGLLLSGPSSSVRYGLIILHSERLWGKLTQEPNELLAWESAG
jgi:hypothetical protein